VIGRDPQKIIDRDLDRFEGPSTNVDERRNVKCRVNVISRGFVKARVILMRKFRGKINVRYTG
jgi:hypothetical protein